MRINFHKLYCKWEVIHIIAMQYKIKLPDNYDMELIRKRVRENGAKTDGFKNLLCKLYLIQSIVKGNKENIYCPLYIWENEEGMNKFIFDGYYDNIIETFGRQNIEIGVVYSTNFEIDKLNRYQYLNEVYRTIDSSHSIKHVIDNNIKNIEYSFIVYNPDKWKYAIFKFEETFKEDSYEILHISTCK